jgi:DNA-binding transcriptional ArsR family regulator
MLQEREMTAGEIADAFQISKPSISHHLDLLKRADLVMCERKGQFLIYSLNTTVLEETANWLLDLMSKTDKES